MFEKVNPSHPDKVADRIAGASSFILVKVRKKMMLKKLFLMIKVKFRNLAVSLKLQSLKKQELKAINRAMKKNKKNDKKKGKK